ncbi:histidine kinase dimerization/phosphoacceptor domain-containing protein [Streptomyces sp. NPDC038707]|uniref:histidine kinase dimerization/phosphoacceptor domain-containing protein n=1 Tax=Streptomyces sp. NPDC038707 TaxID=3154329 RepID=UPI003408950B
MTHTGGGGPRARGAWSREVAITAMAFGFCLPGGTTRVGDTLSAPPAAACVIAVVSCSVAAVRHRAPLAALAATTAAGLLVPLLHLLLPPLIEVLTSVAPAAAVPLPGDFSWKDASRMGVVAAAPLAAGLLSHSVRNRRALLSAVEERARRAEKSRDSEARRRVAGERVRIAPELHDLVAHQIALARAQATVAAHFFGTRPEQTRKSPGQLVVITAAALDGLRATVGLLRRSGNAAAPAGPAPGTGASTAPDTSVLVTGAPPAGRMPSARPRAGTAGRPAVRSGTGKSSLADHSRHQWGTRDPARLPHFPVAPRTGHRSPQPSCPGAPGPATHLSWCLRTARRGAAQTLKGRATSRTTAAHSGRKQQCVRRPSRIRRTHGELAAPSWRQ